MLHLKFAFSSFCMCLSFGPLLRDPLEANACDEFTHSLTQRRLALCFPSTPQFACCVCCILYSICVKPHTHTHHAFCVSLNNSACSFAEKPCCAVQHVVSSAGWLLLIFFLLPNFPSPRFPLNSSSLHLVSLLIFSLLTSCHPLLCSLSTFFSRLLHLDMNSLIAYTSFLLPLSCSKSTGFTFTHLLSSQSLLLAARVTAVCVCIYTRGPEYGERD